MTQGEGKLQRSSGMTLGPSWNQEEINSHSIFLPWTDRSGWSFHWN